MTNGDDALELPEAERRARDVVSHALDAYATSRVASYEKLRLRTLLTKDLLMVTLRGIASTDDLLLQLFAAFESSSEETQMGSATQIMATDLAAGAIDLGDVLVEREGDLWVVEVKSQTNTVNSRSRPQIIRILQRRVGEYERYQPGRRRQVRAMIGVLRGNPRDSTVRYSARNHADQDIDGFEYRYLVGPSFWNWLTGRPGISSLVGDVTPVQTRISAARSACIARVRAELDDWLAENNAPPEVPSILRLVQGRTWPRATRRLRAPHVD